MFIWSPGLTLAEIEKQAIQQALRFYHGNKTVTATSLGCSPRTIYDKLEQYSVEEKAEKDKKDTLQKTNEEFIKRERGAPDAISQGLAPRFWNNPNAIETGVRVESAQEYEGPKVPVSKQPDVLPVLPEQAARSNPGKSAKRV